MRKILNIFNAVLMIAALSGSPVFSLEVEENNDKMITGLLVKVDIKNQSIHVKENSRIVKFKASPDICEKFKNRINSDVDITYKIGVNKSLQIITIVVSEKKADSDKAAAKSKTPVKDKTKK